MIMLGGAWRGTVQITNGWPRILKKCFMTMHFLLLFYAMLISLQRKRIYEKAIRRQLFLLKRELMNEEGGFYAALDADSKARKENIMYGIRKRLTELVRQ